MLTLHVALLNMRHLVFGINFQIYSVNLTSPVSIHLLIHLSTHLCRHPTLIISHFFTLSLEAQNLPFQQIIPTLVFCYLLQAAGLPS